MSDLSDISCDDLKGEISRRRLTKEVDIRKKYSAIEVDVRNKYEALREAIKLDHTIELALIGSNRSNKHFDHERMFSEIAHNYYYHRIADQDLANELLRELPNISAFITPCDILKVAEQNMLNTLRDAMLDEIGALYKC